MFERSITICGFKVLTIRSNDKKALDKAMKKQWQNIDNVLNEGFKNAPKEDWIFSNRHGD